MTRFVLDVTRSISRAGRGAPTGIDRVETAYIDELARRDPGALAFARVRRDSYVTVPLAAVAEVARRLRKPEPIAPPALSQRMRLRATPAQRGAATWLARNALGQGATPAAALATVGAQEYVNVGHTNLNDAVMAAVRPALITVMVHDLIPITHPQYTRAGVTERFAGRMTATATHADRVIANSHATARDVERIFPAFGRTPPVSVAHLGVEASALRHAPAPPGEFICLGTIEPRKNHAVLLDAWQRLSEIGTPPPLLFAGRRGWRNREVFARLDARPQGVTEDATLSDAALWPRLAAARALLFPSRVEGYGLPALEAAQIGLPVLATDLPVFRELLGPWATYLPPDDPAAWARGVSDIAKIPLGVRGSSRSGIEQPPIPRWHSHFRHVFGED